MGHKESNQANKQNNLRLIVGDWTFVGLCHMLCHCIGQFIYTIRWLLSDILGVISETSISRWFCFSLYLGQYAPVKCKKLQENLAKMREMKEDAGLFCNFVDLVLVTQISLIAKWLLFKSSSHKYACQLCMSLALA